MKLLNRLFARSRFLRSFAAGALIALWAPLVARAADDAMCINWNSSVPSLDGQIKGDPGWLNASQYSFVNGTPQQYGQFQLTRDVNNVYLSFNIDKLPSFDGRTRIILLLRPDESDPAKDWRIHVFPGSDTGATAPPGAAANPLRIQTWKNSASWTQQQNCEPATDATCSTPTSLVEAKVMSGSASATDNSYRVEMRLSLGPTAIDVSPSAAQIRMAINVLRVYRYVTPGPSFADQLNWPTTVAVAGAAVFPNPDGTVPLNAHIMQNPASSDWGTVNLAPWSTPCAGVKLKNAWINSQTNNSTLTAPVSGNPVTNTLNVNVENTGTVDAGHVLARISSSKFGSTAATNFGAIGPPNPGTVSPGNPVGSYTSANPLAIGPGTTRQLVPMAWTLTAAEYSNHYQTHYNVCSRIELDVDPAHPAGVNRTQIANRYFYWNISMQPASTFSDTAVLDTKGYEAPPRANEPQRFELMVDTREIAPRHSKDLGLQTAGSGARLSDEPAAGGLRTSTEQQIPPQSSFPLIPLEQAQSLLEIVGGIGHYREGAGFLVKTVCPYRHTGRYIALEGSSAELMERAICYQYWIYHVGAIKRWTDSLAAAGLVDNGGGHYSIAVPVGQSVNLTTRIEAVEGEGLLDRLSWWQMLLLALVVLAAILFLLWRK